MQPRKNQVNYSDVAELEGLEFLNARYIEQTFSKHSHEGYTVGVIEHGAQGFYRTGGEHTAPQNTIILVNADEIHSGYSATEGGWAYRAMYPLPEHFVQLSRDLGMPEYGAPYFPEPVVKDDVLAAHLKQVFDVLEVSDNPLQRETLVYSALSSLMLRHGQSRLYAAPAKASEQALSQVKSFLDEYATWNVTLAELAQLAGMSPFGLVRAFSKAFGLPPHAYQIQVRLKRARTMLKHGLPLADVAVESGFHDQSHLHRHFKKAMGITPGQYVKANRH